MTLWGSIVRIAPPALLAAAVAACAPGGPRLAQVEPSGVVAGGVPATPEHTLSAGDEFEIRFPFAPDHNDRVTVGMDGTVAPKQLGSVEVGGLTVPEATARLRARYAALLKSPELSLTVRRYAPEVIYVDGWVAHPGLIRSDIPLTVARAVARAGGVKIGAKTSRVLVMRHEGGDRSGGRLHTYEVELGNYAGAGGDDPLLKSFDVVYVPQSPLAAVNEFARQYYQNVPFSTSFHIPPTTAPTILAPQVVAPPATQAPVTAR